MALDAHRAYRTHGQERQDGQDSHSGQGQGRCGRCKEQPPPTVRGINAQWAPTTATATCACPIAAQPAPA